MLGDYQLVLLKFLNTCYSCFGDSSTQIQTVQGAVTLPTIEIRLPLLVPFCCLSWFKKIVCVCTCACACASIHRHTDTQVREIKWTAGFWW